MFRRREGRGSDNNCETRFAENCTKHPITLGDIDNLELLPGRRVDLLKHASIQRIGSSSDLKKAVKAGWVKLFNRSRKRIRKSESEVKAAIIPAVLEDINNINTVERTEVGDIIANELIRNVRTVTTSTYTAAQSDDIILVAVTSTITLPGATSLPGHHFVVKSIGDGITVTIAAPSGETIDGENSCIITVQYNSLTFVSNGVNWFVV